LVIIVEVNPRQNLSIGSRAMGIGITSDFANQIEDIGAFLVYRFIPGNSQIQLR